MNENSTTNGIIRGGLAATGGAAFAASHDEWIQIFGAIVTLLSIVWSVIEKRRAAKLPPASGAGLLALGLGALTLAGCHTPGSPTEMQAFVNTLAHRSAYVGCGIDLAENPGHRAAYGAAVVALQSLVDRENYDPAEFIRVLDALPGKPIGDTGAIVIEGGVLLWSATSGTWIDVDSAPFVKAALTGVLRGLQEAMARPTGTATRALAPALPTPCVVPKH